MNYYIKINITKNCKNRIYDKVTYHSVDIFAKFHDNTPNLLQDIKIWSQLSLAIIYDRHGTQGNITGIYDSRGAQSVKLDSNSHHVIWVAKVFYSRFFVTPISNTQFFTPRNLYKHICLQHMFPNHTRRNRNEMKANLNKKIYAKTVLKWE